MKKIILALALGVLSVPAHAQYENTFLGALTGTYITTGSYNTYDGWNVGIFNKAGSYNTAVGHQSLFGNGGVYRADYNTAVGGQTGANIKDGANYNTMLGYRAGYTLTVGTNNVLIGPNAVTPSSTTSNYMNIAGLIRGDLKLSSVTIRGNLYANSYYGDGSHLSGVASPMPDVVYSTGGTMSGMLVNNKGINAHHYEIGGSTVLSVRDASNVYAGKLAGGNSGTANAIVGHEAGAVNVGDNNSFLGYQSGFANISGGLNTFLVTQAGWASTGNRNTIIGGFAGTSVTGGDNIIIGANSGAGLITGTRNILIGSMSPAVPDTTTNAYLNIGNTIVADMDTSSITLKGNAWANAITARGNVTVADADIVFSTTTGSRGFIFQDGQTMTTNLGRIYIGTNVAIGGSNAGIQYADARSNRGQIRMNQFGNNGGIAGITGFKSRGVDVSSFAPVQAGDVLVRMTGIGIPLNSSSLFLAGTYSLNVATSGPLTAQVPTYWEWNSTDFNGASGVVMNTTPDGSLVVKSSVSAPRFYGDGSGLTGVLHSFTETDPTFTGSEAFNITASSTALWNSGSATTIAYPFSTTNSSFTVGHIDAFGRHDIWLTAPSAFLRLGASALDGDPFNSDSEGIGVFKPSVNRQLTLQSEDTRLSEADWAKYFWMVSPDVMAVSAYDHTKDLFSVTMASSQTYVNGGLRYTDGSEGAGKVLTSNASGVATWQTPSGGGIPVMTLTAMEAYASASAGLPLIVSDASAPYSMCMSTGTDAGASVLLNTTIHCQ